MGRNTYALASLCLLFLLGGCSTPGEPPRAFAFAAASPITDKGVVQDGRACGGHGRVRVAVEDGGECLRYYAAGLDLHGPAVVYLHGDDPVRVEAGTGAEAEMARALQAAARRWATALGRPYILLARPGVFGSTGDHAMRRSPREVALVDAALDRIKARHGLKRLVLAGMSGGGHLVAALLPRRADISCAVVTSGVVAVQMRARLRGWPATGRADAVDPMDEVGLLARRIAPGKGPRVFIVGDPADRNTPFAAQRAYYRALRRHGIEAYIAVADGRGPDDHELTRTAHAVADWCAADVPANMIVERAAALSG